MLVLSRRNDESIVIGGDIKMAILGARGKKLQMGVTAPKDVLVCRREAGQAIAKGTVDRSLRLSIVISMSGPVLGAIKWFRHFYQSLAY